MQKSLNALSFISGECSEFCFASVLLQLCPLKLWGKKHKRNDEKKSRYSSEQVAESGQYRGVVAFPEFMDNMQMFWPEYSALLLITFTFVYENGQFTLPFFHEDPLNFHRRSPRYFFMLSVVLKDVC